MDRPTTVTQDKSSVPAGVPWCKRPLVHPSAQPPNVSSSSWTGGSLLDLSAHGHDQPLSQRLCSDCLRFSSPRPGPQHNLGISDRAGLWAPKQE